jgi:hypothetical protein
MLAYIKKQKGDKYAAAKTAIVDCAQVCQLVENLKKRKSELVSQANALCAAACKRCREACEAIDDPKLKVCIENCRNCEQACK